MNDLKFAIRQLRKNPGFTAVAVLTLALGIGANTAIFTLINRLILKPLNARDPHRLVGVYCHDRSRADDYRPFSYPNFTDLRANGDVFEDLLAFSPTMVGVTEGETTRRTIAAVVSSSYFSTLGVLPVRGRVFLPEEENKPVPVVIASDGWWRRHGADPELIGQTITVNATPLTVVGITAKGFTGATQLETSDLYLPLGLRDSLTTPLDATRRQNLTDRADHSLFVVGRLKAGLDFSGANSRLAVLSDQLAKAYPVANTNQIVTVARLPRVAISDSPVNETGVLLGVGAVLMGLSGVVLLIACLNLANMLLARNAARRKEIAIRIAVGATRPRLLRQLLTEGFLLSLLGGMGALVFAFWTTDLLVGSLQRALPVPLEMDFAPDWRVGAATLAFCAFATLFFALGPAWKLTRVDVNSDLKEQAAEDPRGARDGLFASRHWLVISQIALSLALLVAAGLFARGAFHAVRLDPGFSLDRGFYVQLDASPMRYSEPQVRELHRALLERIRALPGVEAASLAATVPLGDVHFGKGVQRGGATSEQGQVFRAGFNVIATDYFRTLGVPLLRGREFTLAEVERTNASRVAIIEQRLAEQLWPEEEALGKRVQFSDRVGGGGAGVGTFLPANVVADHTFEVVGVVPAVRDNLLSRVERPFIYVPAGQSFQPAMALHIRAKAHAPAEGVMRAVRDEIRQQDPRLPVIAMKSLRLHLESSLQVWLIRTAARLFGTLGAVALLLAILGVYGVRAYTISRRTRELGIRLALGASTAHVLRLILREGVFLTAMGVGLGMLLAAGVAKLVSGMLFEVRAFDPFVFVVTPLLLAVAALFACWLPARRAAKVDPMEALRYE